MTRIKQEYNLEPISGCAYLGCSSFNNTATKCCCSGCRWNHEDNPTSEESMPEVEFEIPQVAIDYAVGWLERINWHKEYVEQKVWLCLLNGAYVATDSRFDKERYVVIDKQVCDSHTVGPFISTIQYKVLCLCYDLRTAKRIAKTLNNYKVK